MDRQTEKEGRPKGEGHFPFIPLWIPTSPIQGVPFISGFDLTPILRSKEHNGVNEWFVGCWLNMGSIIKMYVFSI